MSETEYALGTYCGVTFAGIKAASLISIKRECAKCIGKYIKHFKRIGFDFCILRLKGERVLLLVYNREKLWGILSNGEARDFLSRFGYDYTDLRGALAQLKSRMGEDGFPHEIGLFLGYPIEDVKGFIEHPNEDVKLVGYWKVYENAECKKKVFERYNKCTENIVKKLSDGIPLEKIFNRSVSFGS